MKVSIDWLKDLVEIKTPVAELISLINLRTIGTKEITDNFIELDMKGYNRADLLSLRGVAEEIAAITSSSIKFEENNPTFDQNLPKLEVSVTDPELIPVYCLVKIEGLEPLKSSSQWIKKLEDCGMRSVNQIVDVTNLIMLEFGQPLHSFNASTVSNEQIIVRTAKNNEKLTTLDGKERALTEKDLVITDPTQIFGLAGVMGGENSEIKDSGQTTILLEAAIFDPITIRATAQRLNLTSEASKRFQHGLTSERLYQALDKAIKMYQNLGGKVTALTIIDNSQVKSPKILVRQDKINSLIGVKIKPSDVEEYLTRLNFKVNKTGNDFEVIPPFYRLDIEREVDVIEEIARLFGYENIPSNPLIGDQPASIDQSVFILNNKIIQSLTTQGLDEILTYSFYSTQIMDLLNFDKNSLIKVSNPISSETEYLRDKLWPNLLEKTILNLKNYEQVRIFEIGKVYTIDEDKNPKEEYKLAGALSNTNKDNLLELKQRLEDGLKQAGFEINFVKKDSPDKIFHPNGYFEIKYRDIYIGFLAQVHPRVTDKLGTTNRVSVFEININLIINQ